MVKAIRIHQHGGPEVLRWEEVDPGTPGPGEALVRHEAVGLNYIDVYHRSGLYPLPTLPATPGLEAAGVVEAIGPGVIEVAVGDRVAYAGVPPGAYAEKRRIPAHRLVHAARRHIRAAGGRHDAPGHDGAVSAEGLLAGRPRHDPADPRRRRRASASSSANGPGTWARP